MTLCFTDFKRNRKTRWTYFIFDSQSCLGFESEGTKTLGLVPVSFQLWFSKSPSIGPVHLSIFQEVSPLVLSQNIRSFETLLQSHHVLVLVPRLKTWDSRSCPSLLKILNIKEYRYQTYPFINNLRGLVLVTKYWSRISVREDIYRG